MADVAPTDVRTRRQHRRARTRLRYFPETALDDFSRVDSAVEFYTRVGALLQPEMVAVDFGAGRGMWHADGTSATRRRLQDLRGKAKWVIGLDVDPVVAENPSLDEAHVIDPHGALPLTDASVDMVVSDFTFEHVDDPGHVTRELDRILRPGGWICARTPNKWGYIGIGGQLIPNRLHVPWLTRLQPERKDIDVFPTRYRLNTAADLARYFPPSRFQQVVYTMPGEPSYAGGSPVLWNIVGVLQRLTPRAAQPMLLVFIRKLPIRGSSSD